MTTFAATHVLFDLDGTLVDTRASVRECYRRVFRERLGRDFPPAEIDGHELFAMRPRELFARVEPERVEELYQAYHETYPACADHIRVFDGARALIEGLVARGRRPSLVTNKGIDRTLIDLSVAGIAPALFATIVTAEDTVDRKPHPAPILLGLERAKASARDAIYVGDGPQDILSAHAAGLACIAVGYGFYEVEVLAPHHPALLVGSIAELGAALGLAGERMAS